MTKIVFVFDELSDGVYRTVLQGNFYRESPFAKYIGGNLDYGDIFEYAALRDIMKLSEGSHDRVYIFPIGVNMFFDLNIQSLILHNLPGASELKRLFADIAAAKVDIFVMFDMSWECAREHHVESLPMIASLLNFPVYKMIYMGNNTLTSRLSGLPAKFGYIATGAWFFEFYTHVLHKECFDRIDIQPRFSQAQTKSALSLNRRVRAHRVLLGAYLSSRNYLVRTFYSFGGRDANDVDNRFIRDEAIDTAKAMAHFLPDSSKIINDHINYVLENEPFEIDLRFREIAQDSAQFNRSALATSSELELCYRLSEFSIVTETDFGGSDHDNLLTEKTFKALLFGHPLVVFSGPGALRELQGMGYQTYDRVIPETYDTIADPNLRFLSLTESIDMMYATVCESPESFRAQTSEIAQFNQRYFINETPRHVRSFAAQLIRDIKRLNTSGYRPVHWVASESASNLNLNFSRFGGVVFYDGFYHHEIAGKGRWCSANGRLTIWLGKGDWSVTIFIRAKQESTLPDLYQDGKRLSCSTNQLDDRMSMTFILRNVFQFATLQFNSKFTFIPAEADKKSDSHRRLGFWLFDEFFVSPVSLRSRSSADVFAPEGRDLLEARCS